MLRIYDTRVHNKIDFVPLEPGKVKMYTCGPTVYDNVHIGNARTFLSFDVIRRYLIYKGFDVTFAQNLTDVDDKIINRANENGESSSELATRFADAFIAVMRDFDILDPDIRPRATAEIGPMIAMIKELISGGHAYAAGNDVYFDVRSYPDYGAISGRNVDDMISGARVEVDTMKKDPADFVLWKGAKPGEPSWPSPWGDGRPGWHSECAAMIHRYMGSPIDIHGGGSDLIFPHHENESAQATCAWHEPLAKSWMHTGMLLVDGEKMSKSLGNFFTLKDILAQYPAAALRLLMVQTHYRSPLDFSFERLKGAVSSIERVSNTVKNLRWAADHSEGDADKASREELISASESARADFISSMDDDFNTAGATGAIFGLLSVANIYLDKAAGKVDVEAAHAAADTIVDLFDILGVSLDIEQADYPEEIIALAARVAGYAGTDRTEAARAIIARRQVARANKDWDVADGIRQGCHDLGLIIEDTAAGARIHRS